MRLGGSGQGPDEHLGGSRGRGPRVPDAADDFLAFFKAREKALLDRVEAAMGKLIARDIPQPQVEDFGDYEEDDPVEEELVAWIESKGTFQRFSHGITPKHLPNLRPPN